MTGYVMGVDTQATERLKLDENGWPLPPDDLVTGAAVCLCLDCAARPLHERCTGCPRQRAQGEEP